VNSIPITRTSKSERPMGGSGSRGSRRDRNDGEKERGDDGRRPTGRSSTGEPKSRLQQWLQLHSGWVAMWLEGIDPPRRGASTPNVTMLMIGNLHFKNDEFGFLFSSSRGAAKKKEREKVCAREIVDALDHFQMDNMCSWCQMPSKDAKHDVGDGDVERLTSAVQRRCPKATVEMPEPAAFVLVAVVPWGPHDRHQHDLALTILDKFDTGFAELLREARRVSGLVRKQWFFATVTAELDGSRPVVLGVGLATDRGVARARAVHAAEFRTTMLKESMFQTLGAPPATES